MEDRKKFKDIVREAKAHSGLQCQWKKKKYIFVNCLNNNNNNNNNTSNNNNTQYFR